MSAIVHPTTLSETSLDDSSEDQFSSVLEVADPPSVDRSAVLPITPEQINPSSDLNRDDSFKLARDEIFLKRTKTHWTLAILVNTIQASLLGTLIICFNILVPAFITLTLYHQSSYAMIIMSYQIAQITGVTILVNLHVVSIATSLQHTKLQSYFMEKFLRYFVIIAFLSFVSMMYFFISLHFGWSVVGILAFLGIQHAANIPFPVMIGATAFMINFIESSAIQIYLNRFLLRTQTDVFLRYLYFSVSSVGTIWFIFAVCLRFEPVFVMSSSLVFTPLIAMTMTYFFYIRPRMTAEMKRYIEVQHENHLRYLRYKELRAKATTETFEAHPELELIAKNERNDLFLTVIMSIWAYAKSSTVRSFLLIASFAALAVRYLYNANFTTLFGNVFFYDASELVLVVGIPIAVYLSFMYYIRKADIDLIRDQYERLNRMTLAFCTLFVIGVCVFVPPAVFLFVESTGLRFVDPHVFLCIPLLFLFGAVSMASDASRGALIVFTGRRNRLLVIVVLGYVVICLMTLVTAFCAYKYLLTFEALTGSYNVQSAFRFQIVYCVTVSVFGCLEYFWNLILLRYLTEMRVLSRRFFHLMALILGYWMIQILIWITIIGGFITSTTDLQSLFTPSFLGALFVGNLIVGFCFGWMLLRVTITTDERARFSMLVRLFVRRAGLFLRYLLFENVDQTVERLIREEPDFVRTYENTIQLRSGSEEQDGPPPSTWWVDPRAQTNGD